MKILFVVSRPLEINTSSSIRNKATIEGLLKLGHCIDLITTEFDKKHTYLDNTISSESLNINYLKLGGFLGYAKIGGRYKILKPLKKLVWVILSKLDIYDNLKGIVDYALKININDGMYDLIISSSDPKSSHLFISKMYENVIVKNTPWIQIWGDPFLSDITKNNRLLNSKIKKEENRLLKYASKVIYVSSLTLNEQKKIYPQYAMKMFFEPIPYVKKEIYPIDNEPKKHLTFLYCGEYLSSVRNILPLYNAIKNTNHRLIICGNSNLNLESSDHIQIYPRISFEETKELEKKSDVLIHLSNLKGSQIPGKVYQYSGTNKLILFLLDGEIDALINTFNKYKRYIFSHNNINDISTTIKQIMMGFYDYTKFIVDEFEPQIIANKILKIQ